MPAPTTNVDICNLALDMLAEAPIGALTDDRRVARWFNRNYDNARAVALRSNAWKFAIERVELTKEATAPVFGWQHEYIAPADSLRILPITWDGTRKSRSIDHEFENKRILTNHAGPLKVRYIKDFTVIADMPQDFILFLAATMGQRLAHWLTGKSNFAAIAKEAATEALINAYNTDAIEEPMEDAEDNDYLSVRSAYLADFVPYWGSGSS